MEAQVWTLIGIMAAALFGSLAMFFYLGARIDALGARIDSRLDAQTSRIDALSAKLDAHIERHSA